MAAVEKGSPTVVVTRETSNSPTTEQPATNEQGQDNATNSPNTSPIQLGFKWEVGERVLALDKKEMWYPAVIQSVDKKKETAKIHFEKWSKKHDRVVGFHDLFVKGRDFTGSRILESNIVHENHCSVCGKDNNPSTLMRCQTCAVSVHTRCIPKGFKVDKSKFYCGATLSCFDPLDLRKQPGVLTNKPLMPFTKDDDDEVSDRTEGDAATENKSKRKLLANTNTSNKAAKSITVTSPVPLDKSAVIGGKASIKQAEAKVIESPIPLDKSKAVVVTAKNNKSEAKTKTSVAKESSNTHKPAPKKKDTDNKEEPVAALPVTDVSVVGVPIVGGNYVHFKDPQFACQYLMITKPELFKIMRLQESIQGLNLYYTKQYEDYHGVNTRLDANNKNEEEEGTRPRRSTREDKSLKESALAQQALTQPPLLKRKAETQEKTKEKVAKVETPNETFKLNRPSQEAKQQQKPKNSTSKIIKQSASTKQSAPTTAKPPTKTTTTDTGSKHIVYKDEAMRALQIRAEKAEHRVQYLESKLTTANELLSLLSRTLATQNSPQSP
eukprot:m.61482 g.61482  ORF g.61482 m.61482 type:complete len:552 (+) comp11417_c1_seq1:92-1747(+)